MPVFRKQTPEEFQELLKLQNNEPTLKLTPKEKFNRLLQTMDRRSRIRIRKFHFNIIEHDKKAYLFDGRGKELGIFTNDVHGIREARVLAVELFADSPDKNGGYTFDGPNFEAKEA